MSIKVNNKDFNVFLDELSKKYKIFAPIRLEKRGRLSDTDMIRYGEIKQVEDIVWDEKSTFSPKEVFQPITQTLFYFTEDEYKEPKIDDKKIIVFLRPCDINGVRRHDTIFLKNGKIKDNYYKQIRSKIKFVMIECKKSFENCFCVSMDSNVTDDYAMAVRFKKGSALLEIKDESLNKTFTENNIKGETVEFTPEYVQENKVKVTPPDVDKMPQGIYKHEMWKEYSTRCIACGRCNTACITCTCFTTSDLFYDDNKNVGERRRVWDGCQIDGFTDMAGGHSFREKHGEKMRFKTMHKVYDYNKRFGEHMCVGCGRCDDICPEYISFSNCINKVTDIV